MPRIGDNENMQNFKAGHFGFSATNPLKLGSTEYTIVSIAVDESGSTKPFQAEMIKALKEIIKACKHSPRADSLMIRLVAFDDKLREVHGFRPLAECNIDDYDTALNGGGLTSVYDAAENVITATSKYGESLIANDLSVNGILFVITDGEDNRSASTKNTVRDALKGAVSETTLESLVSVLIGVNVNDPALAAALKSFKDDAGFTQYIELDNASAGKLAKLAEFVSKSISAQSQALGTGGPSKQLNLTV